MEDIDPRICSSILREVESAHLRECAASLAGASHDGTHDRLHETLRISQSTPESLRVLFDAEGGVPWRMDRRFYIQLVQKDRRDLEHLRG
jgi:hypothetical protein